jgi:hypothetical protein
VARRSLLLLAALVAVVSLVAVALALRAGGSSVESGPLVPPGDSEAKASIGVPIPMNKPFSFGLLVVENTSDSAVVLDQAELVRAGAGIELLGAYGAPEGSVHIGFLPGYNPRGRHLRGMTVAPHAQVQVVLGMEVVKRGRHRFEAVALNYHGDGTAYRRSYSLSGRLCSPVAAYVDKCPGLLDQGRTA